MADMFQLWKDVHTARAKVDEARRKAGAAKAVADGFRSEYNVLCGHYLALVQNFPDDNSDLMTRERESRRKEINRKLDELHKALEAEEAADLELFAAEQALIQAVQAYNENLPLDVPPIIL